MDDDARNSWLVPGAILIAGILLAFTVYKTNHHAAVTAHGDPSQMRPISTSDHELGNPAAPVVIVEYADIDSAYSKDFESTMNQVMSDNSSNGNVAWVFRDFPLVDQNVNAEEESEAAECASAQKGTTGFFAFINTLQAAVPGESIFDPTDLPTLVQSIGLSLPDFQKCMSAHTYRQHVADDYANALAVGATGSPYSILLVKGQAPQVISGSIPYTTMKQIVSQAVAKVLAQ